MGKDDQSSVSSKALANDEGFLGRWSRRKAEARRTDGDPSADIVDKQQAEAERSAVEADHQDQLPVAVDPATLPDIDKMNAGSDFSIFMQAGVPPALKTKALRKLWRVKPELANLDGLLDYGEDLTGSFKVVDHLKTAYRIGKGFLRDDDADKPEEGGPTEETPAVQDGVTDASTIAKDEDQPIAIDQTEDDAELSSHVVQGEASPEKISKG